MCMAIMVVIVVVVITKTLNAPRYRRRGARLLIDGARFGGTEEGVNGALFGHFPLPESTGVKFLSHGLRGNWFQRMQKYASQNNLLYIHVSGTLRVISMTCLSRRRVWRLDSLAKVATEEVHTQPYDAESFSLAAGIYNIVEIQGPLARKIWGENISLVHRTHPLGHILHSTVMHTQRV
jgi:hypothetical protein